MTPGPAHEPAWWHGAVLYQLYVRSWRDADGDGYGDLAGVLAGLDYLEWLGVDGVWLSPTMPSPGDDWGYDVSDYTGVHPELGTLEDLDRLVSAARDRGIAVLLDLVPNHTSSAHPWFVDASASRDSPHRGYYVWADPAPDGGPPNNWLDFTGEPAWTFHEATGQYFLHNFLASQPDLDWWYPEVHAAFGSILRFWLDRGVAGFRIDVAHGLYHDDQLRDDPPAEPGDPRARHGLLSVHSMHRPEVHDVYRDWRTIARSYVPEALLLGETWALDPAELSGYFGDDDELQLAFNFEFVLAELTAPSLAAAVAATFAALPDGACPVWTASNHDLSRAATRWCGGDESKMRLALTVMCMLPGTVVLYYGDEIAMEDVDVPPERRRDPMTRAGCGGRFNRDRARTPMQWSDDACGDFAPEGTEPWLPVGDAARRSVAAQRDDPASTLSLVRELLALRRRTLSGGVAPYAELEAGPAIWRFRSGPVVVEANMSDAPELLGPAHGAVLLSSRPHRRPDEVRGGVRHLEPCEAVVRLASPHDAG